MAWTQTDIDKLKSAMAKGARTVTYDDGSVTYHSLSEMERLLTIMQRDLSTEPAVTRTVAKFDRGFR